MYVYHRSWVFLFHIRSCRTVFFSLFESLSCFLSYMHSTHVLSSLSSLFDLIAAAADAVPPRYSSFSFLFVAHTFLVPTYFSFRYLFALVSVGFCWCSNSATVVFLFNASMDVLWSHIHTHTQHTYAFRFLFSSIRPVFCVLYLVCVRVFSRCRFRSLSLSFLCPKFFILFVAPF